MRRRRGQLGSAIAVLMLGLVLPPERTLRADDSPVLHEYVPDIQPNEAVLATSAAAVSSGQTVVYGGEVLHSPDSKDGTQDAPAFIATPGDGAVDEEPGQRSPSFKPDRLTELEGSLSYYEAFNPAIAPFKRVTSLDATTLDRDGVTPVLRIGSGVRRQVTIESPSATAPDARPRDRFWGDVTLDFSTGRSVPLPSVSPESRILSVETTPEIGLHIERDAADNFYAHLTSSLPDRPVRMTFLTDAPRAYFGTQIPHVKVTTLEGEVPQLEPSIAHRALGFAATLGLSRASTLDTALAKLTQHFREFVESAQPPPNTGDVYLDLARGKKGVCRHRAYAFVVTAHALGIPARFVQNEAHSWVEVKLPELGFMRIDLGGAAHGLTAHNTDDRPVYTPPEPDRLPRPESYKQSYSTLDHGVTGLRPKAEDVIGRWVSTNEAGQPPGAESTFSSGPSAHGSPPPAAASTRASKERQPLVISLETPNAEVLRGGKLLLSGRLRDGEGHGVPDLRVEISLASSTRSDRMLLGVTVTDEQGFFRAGLGVPPDLAVGDYRMVVLTPGNTQYLPAIAE